MDIQKGVGSILRLSACSPFNTALKILRKGSAQLNQKYLQHKYFFENNGFGPLFRVKCSISFFCGCNNEVETYTTSVFHSLSDQFLELHLLLFCIHFAHYQLLFIVSTLGMCQRFFPLFRMVSSPTYWDGLCFGCYMNSFSL